MNCTDPERLLPEREELPIPLAFPLDGLHDRRPSDAANADGKNYEP